MNIQPTSHRPFALPVGSLVLVMPDQDARLSARHLGDIGRALLLQSAGHDGHAKQVIAAVEAQLGVHPAHRAALLTGEDTVKALIREARERRGDRQQARATFLNRSVEATRISETVESLLRKAASHRDKAAELEAADQDSVVARRPQQNRKKVKDHLTAARVLEIEASTKATTERDLRWLLGATAETVQLAQARGEDVDHEEIEVAFEVKDEHGAVLRHRRGPRKGEAVMQYDRITRTILRSRGGGIETAYEKGHLDGQGPKAEALKVTGLRYRQAYEIIEALVSSRGEGGSGYGAKAPQMRVVSAGQDLAFMRAKLSRRERQVLDLVCGQDLRLRPASEFLKAGFPATRRALRNGLVTALVALQTAHEGIREGLTEDAVERVERVGRLLNRVRI